MTSESERLPATDAEAELLLPVIGEMLREVPESWGEFDLDALSHVQENALYLLTEAGMVERLGWLRASMANHATYFEVCFQATGEGGFAKAMEKAVALEYETWADAWRAWKAGKTGRVSPFVTEAMSPQRWRLTDQGVIARRDLDERPDAVYDFVLRRGMYGPGYWLRLRICDPDKFRDNVPLIGQLCEAHDIEWVALPRPPVSGDGQLVTIRAKDNPAGPQAVSVANWREGGDALAKALGPIVEQCFDRLGSPSPDEREPPAYSEVQLLILDELRREEPQSAIQLTAHLNVSRDTLYGKKGKGGLTELKDWGDVTHSKAAGGYSLSESRRKQT